MTFLSPPAGAADVRSPLPTPYATAGGAGLGVGSAEGWGSGRLLGLRLAAHLCDAGDRACSGSSGPLRALWGPLSAPATERTQSTTYILAITNVSFFMSQCLENV